MNSFLRLLMVVFAAVGLVACGSGDPSLTLNLKYPTLIALPSGGKIDGKTKTFTKIFTPAVGQDIERDYRIKDLVFSVGGKTIPLNEPKVDGDAARLVIEDLDQGIEFAIEGMVTTNAAGIGGYKAFGAKATLTAAGKVGDLEYPSPTDDKFTAEFSISTEGGQIADLMLQEDDDELKFNLTVSGELESIGNLGLVLSLTEVSGD